MDTPHQVEPIAASSSRPLLTVAEAGRLAGWSEAKTYRALNRGELPGAVRVNNRWHVRARIWRAFLNGEPLPDADTPTQLRRVG